IPDTALVTLNAGSTLAMSASAETIGNLAGTGTVTTNSLAGTLSIGGKNADATFAGLITEQTGYALSIAKVGSGKLALTNVANAFSGNLTVTGGTLDLSGAGKVYTGAYNNTAVVTVGAGAKLVVANLAYGGTLGNLADYSARRVLAGGTLEVLGNNGGLGIGQDFTVNAGLASSFLFNPTVAGQALTLSGNANDNINLNGPLNLGGAGDVAITEVIQGAGSLTKTGNAKLTLGAANTFTGGVTAGAGTLVLSNAQALGTGPLAITGALVLDNAGPAGFVNAQRNAVTLGGDVTFTGTRSLNLGQGVVTLTGNRVLNVANSTLAVGGAVTGAFGLTKTGAGTLALRSPASNFSGGLTVNAGTVAVSRFLPTALGTGPVTLAGGTLAFDTVGGSLRTFDLSGDQRTAAVPVVTTSTTNLNSFHNSVGDAVPLNTTRGYVGKAWFPAGTYAFAKSFDDGLMLKIGTTTLINDATWTNLATATFTAATAGWYDLDVRFQQGAGGVGATPTSPSLGLWGLGIKSGAATAVGTDYTRVEFESLASLGIVFAETQPAAAAYGANLTLAADSTLRVDDFAAGQALTLSGVLSGPGGLTKSGAGVLVLS
ncbi:MAG: hypothetical protein EBT84_11925, partial [Sphingomonadaceae bacterium]|nr:hypothetical protein [Sphingomonadaceae bacterium]